MVDEFSRLQRERVDDGELEGAQDYMAGNFPLTIETPDAIATQVLNQLFYELPLEELPDLSRARRAVTPDDIQRVARRFLRPGPAVGRAGRRRRQVRRRARGRGLRQLRARFRSSRARSDWRPTSTQAPARTAADRAQRRVRPTGAMLAA